MRKRLFLPFIALSLFSVALASNSNAKQVNASYETKVSFEDNFDTNEINPNWNTTGSVSLEHQYSSMRINPSIYTWESSVNFNHSLSGNYKVIFDISSSKLGGWFAIAFGNPNASALFTQMNGGVVFFDNNYAKVLDVQGEKLDSFGDYTISAFGTEINVRRSVEISINSIGGNRSSMQCEIFENGQSLGTVFESPYLYENSLDGYLGFNSNLKKTELYSIEILNGSNQRLCYDDFSNSSVLYPTSGSANSEWYSTNFDEEELKVGYVSSLYLSNINSGVTYVNELELIDNADIGLGYIIESEAKYSAMDFDVESGFVIAKNEQGNSFHFFGVRRLAIGYALIHYSTDSAQVDKIDCLNENDNLTVSLTLNIYQNGDVEFTCGEVEFNIKIQNYAGFVGLFNTNVLQNRNNGAGAFFNYFRLKKSSYYKRDGLDVYNNFNGVKKTYFEDIDEYVYDYYVSRQEWNVGAKVTTSKWKRTDQGNGKLEFNGSANNSFFGPKNLYKDFVVKFDVEVTSTTIPYGGTLGLQFGNSRPGLYYDNTKSIGIGYYHDQFDVYRAVPTPTNMDFAPGANTLFYDDDGEVTNIYDTTKKFTLMFIGRNNMVSMYYLLDGEDDSHLNKVRTTVVCKEGETTDGYLAVFGANGISFTIDNLSIINLDLDAPACAYNGTSAYQEVTRLDFTQSTDLSGMTSTNVDISGNKAKINNGGEIKTTKLVNDFILRLKVNDVENTLIINQDSLNVVFVNQQNKYVEIDDGVTTQRLDLNNNFDFRNSVLELEKLNKKLSIRLVGGESSLSEFDDSVVTFEIENNNKSVLTIKSLNGFVSVSAIAFINLNKYATILNRDYDPEIDDVDPWPYRPTGETSKKTGCSGSVSASSLVILAISLLGLLVLVPTRRRIRK